MAQLPFRLPQPGEACLLTDGGIETTLIYLNGFDLPHFAAFHLLRTEKGRLALQEYYRGYLRLAARHHTGFVLETPTWRANRDWTILLGYGPDAVAEVNTEAVRLVRAVCAEFEHQVQPIALSGCIGPRGDGYRAEGQMTPRIAHAYHAEQVNALREASVDLITALTMTYPEEAIGIARAASVAGLPCVISFTLERDGRLPDGSTLKEAVEAVDTLNTERPLYYMINCAHPDHFTPVLQSGKGEHWLGRVRGLRSNASRKSHEELDRSTELDPGNPEEWGRAHSALRQEFPQLSVFGGCCGTDDRHIGCLAEGL